MTQVSQFVWEVINDPEQVFTGLFRWTDLHQSALDHFWPEGIIFRNKITGKVLAYQAGKLVAPTNINLSLEVCQ